MLKPSLSVLDLGLDLVNLDLDLLNLHLLKWNVKKNDTNELIYKTGTDLENKELIITRGEWWGRGIDREFGTDKKRIVNYYIVHL